MTETKQSIHILTKVVRDGNLTCNDFAVILYLKHLIWQTGNRYSFQVSAPDMRHDLRITDNRTLKASLSNLHIHNYIQNEIKQMQPNKPIQLDLNQKKFDTENRKEGEYFTKLPINILYALKDGKLNSKEVRLLYYIKSYINSDDMRKQFCYTSIEKTMVKETNISKNTIPKYTEMLKKKKLISIDKHKLGTSYQYNEKGELIFTKYNNHYFLRLENIMKL